MKDAVKLFGILFFGLLTAVIIYPFLHESGHLIAAVLLGAEVLEFNLFPLPNILCNMANMSIVEKIIIGLNGLFLPIFFSAVMLKMFGNSFWNRYISFVLNGISLLASIISAIAVIFFYLGNPVENEDVTQILYMSPNSGITILILTIFSTIYLIIKIALDKPIQRCLAYFGLINKTKSGTA